MQKRKFTRYLSFFSILNILNNNPPKIAPYNVLI